MSKYLKTLLAVFLFSNLAQASEINTPHLNVKQQKRVLEFTNQELPKAFTYDVVNFNQQLAATEKDFTPLAWRYFKSGQKDFLTWQLVQQHVAIVAVAEGAPILTGQSLLTGYHVQLPLVLTYTDPYGKQWQRHLLANSFILNMPAGLAFNHVDFYDKTNPDKHYGEPQSHWKQAVSDKVKSLFAKIN